MRCYVFWLLYFGIYHLCILWRQECFVCCGEFLCVRVCVCCGGTRKNVYCLTTITSTLGQSVKHHYPVSVPDDYCGGATKKERSLRTLMEEKRQILM